MSVLSIDNLDFGFKVIKYVISDLSTELSDDFGNLNAEYGFDIAENVLQDLNLSLDYINDSVNEILKSLRETQRKINEL